MTSLRLAVRRLAQSPGFTVVAVLTLALGIGANTAMFSVVNALLLQPAPYPDSGRLVRIYRTAAQSQKLPHSLPDARDLRDGSQSFASLTVYQGWAYSLAEPGQPAERLNGVTASADLFATLGVQPFLGRAYTAEEQLPGRDNVVVLSYDCWRRRFSGDPQAVGRTLRMDGENVTIVGVMPQAASYPLYWGRVDVWRPLRQSKDWREIRDVYWLNMIGRLRPGISLGQAHAEASGIAARLAQAFPGTNTGTGLNLVPMHESAMADTGRRLTWLTLGLAGFVLLIACANLSNLQLARAAANARTFAVRVALGAPRSALIGQSLAETVVLALAGGALGLLFADGLTRLLGSEITVGGAPLSIPLQSGVLAFALLVSIGAGVIFGAAPAWVISRTDANDALKQQARGSTGDRSQHRLRHAMLVAEIALTLVLLSSAGLFLRGLQRFTHRDLGWHAAGLLTASITLPDQRYTTNEQRRTFQEQLLRRVEALPGVERAALASALPISGRTNAPQPVYVEGRPTAPSGQEPLAHYAVVGPHYFETMGTSLVAGRLLPDDLRPDSPAIAVISESMARLLWPGQDPIGKRISRVRGGEWEEIIGVVRDERFAADLGAPDTRMQVYRPLVREPWGYLWIAVRSPAPEALAEPLRRAVAEIDPDLPVDELRTVDQAVDESQHYFHLANQVLGGFAALGLLLSAIGLYGVIAGLVVRRTAEFGIRLALGAQVRDVLWLVLGTGLRLALAGVVLGVAGSFALAEVLRAAAPELPAQDPMVIALVSAALVAVALLACWLPARRATRVDPIRALKAE